MQEAFDELPNFSSPVLEDSARASRAVRRLRDSIELPRCCCSASRAIGKTHFAAARGAPRHRYGFVPIARSPAGWVLSGASCAVEKNAEPGKVFDTFLNGEYANPVIVVDEIEQASGDGQYDPLARSTSA